MNPLLVMDSSGGPYHGQSASPWHTYQDHVGATCTTATYCILFCWFLEEYTNDNIIVGFIHIDSNNSNRKINTATSIVTLIIEKLLETIYLPLTVPLVVPTIDSSIGYINNSSINKFIYIDSNNINRKINLATAIVTEILEKLSESSHLPSTVALVIPTKVPLVGLFVLITTI